MWKEDPEIPDWEFEADEVSAGCYVVRGRDIYGHTVDLRGSDPEQMLRECKEAARRTVSITSAFDVYEFVEDIRATAAKGEASAETRRLMTKLEEAMNLGSSGLEIIGAIKVALLEDEAAVNRLMGAKGRLKLRQVARFVSRAYGR
jgi:hypothetical protein